MRSIYLPFFTLQSGWIDTFCGVLLTQYEAQKECIKHAVDQSTANSPYAGLIWTKVNDSLVRANCLGGLSGARSYFVLKILTEGGRPEDPYCPVLPATCR